MNIMRARQVTEEQLRSWPLYASLRDWSEILEVSRDALRHAMRTGKLKGYIQGADRWHFTRTQILRWVAPGLGKEEDLVGRLIEPGKDMQA